MEKPSFKDLKKDELLPLVTIAKVSANALRKEDVADLNDLYKQLDPTAEPLGWATTAHIAGAHWQFVALLDKRIVGMATLVAYRVRRGYVGRIEDLVVTEELRRKGIGKKLFAACIEEVRLVGGSVVEFVIEQQSTAMRHLAASMRFNFRSVYLAARQPVKPPNRAEEE